jgi:hypothetical protein
MRRRNLIKRELATAKIWLAGLLAVSLLALCVISGLHRGHQDHPRAQHSCAACLMAHGNALADGATDACVVACSFGFGLAALAELNPVVVLELRLPSERAPPV